MMNPMNNTIQNDALVQFHYRLSEDDGALLEDSRDDAAFEYQQGHGQIIPGLEQAMLGRCAGEVFKVRVLPEDAYGVFDPALKQRVSIKMLPKMRNTPVGDWVEVETDHGPRLVRVLSVGQFHADVDANHPYAGKALNFEVEVISVQPANG